MRKVWGGVVCFLFVFFLDFSMYCVTTKLKINPDIKVSLMLLDGNP